MIIQSQLHMYHMSFEFYITIALLLLVIHLMG